MRTLSLTSPLLRGDDVGRAQFILNGHNAFAQDYLVGPIDHAWGELSAQAAYRARYWIGTSLATLEKHGGVYDAALDAYLTGQKPLPQGMLSVRGRRVATRQKIAPLRARALAFASDQAGYAEQAGNHTKYGKAWGWDGVPWCAIFLSSMYLAAGSKAFADFRRGNRWSYCPAIEAAARAGAHNLTIVKDPKPGDGILYDWDRDGVADHTAFFVEGDPRASFVDLGGNTSATNASNGGTVARAHRTARDVRLYFHVGA